MGPPTRPGWRRTCSPRRSRPDGLRSAGYRLPRAGGAGGPGEVQLSRLEREDIARESIERNGKIIVARSLEEGIQVANRIAPEHLELCVDQPFDYLSQIRNAGSIFLGRYDPEPMGDYFAGPNHTLPTMGTAGFTAPSRWTTSSKNLSSATTPVRLWSGTAGRWGCSPARRD